MFKYNIIIYNSCTYLLHTQPAACEPLLHHSRTQGVSEQKCNLNNIDEEKLNLI